MTAAALAQTLEPLQISYSPQPTAGDPIQIRVVNGACDGIFENFEFPPLYDLEGKVLKLTSAGVHYGT